ncbi:IucA/IucC family protein [Undibacterium griseum]|uniref:Iron transporter n=1 Tax=Undibacterium griseum TaxID=2762295 RepID=A0ABR6YMV0_9BURK|nr:IucA/IucC family protein [Undibacterium griseum]MBC3885222.1 iron transporter [Undibacterium griseum]
MQITSNAQLLDSTTPAAYEAGRRSQETLLNCYCREVAGPAGELSVGPLFWQNDWPAAIKMALQRDEGGQVLHVQLPFTGERLLVVVAAASITGNYRYRSPFFHKASGKPWALLDWEAQAALLLREMALKHKLPHNSELMEQVRNSVAMTTLALSCPPAAHFPADPIDAYIDSEQSLVFGHPFHPAPKSRQGFSEDDLARYSPELGARFALHYFAVRTEDIVQQSLLGQRCEEIVAAYAPHVDPGFVAVPVHPWQADHLLTHPLVRQAMSEGRLRHLGAHGAPFFATSSVRSLYQIGNPYFYKFSLNVRLTNCVRKNAWYELEGAIQVSRLMRDLLPGLQREFPGLEVLEEPAFMSVDLHDADPVRNREVIEGFGMILRRNVEALLRPGATPLLAGALFGNHIYGEMRMRQLLGDIAARDGSPLASVTERWFSDYVEQLMHPVLHCYFAHGIVFEPHLQNVVIGLQDGWPSQLFLRDFEGVKLLPGHYPEQKLQEISARAREALWYDDEQGWKRISYCLFVNNFAEAICQLAAEQPALQQRLWSVVRHQLHRYQVQWGSPVSARRINAVLAGEAFPGKTNLSNRFFQRADRASTYVPIGNPIAAAGELAPWN